MARTSRAFWWLLALTTLGRLLLISGTPLKVEEAYYWDYSQHPDLSYFDHPAMVALMIGSSTALGGAHPFWVRLPAVLMFALTSWCVYRVTREGFDEKAALWAAALLALLPTFSIQSLLILPDSPLLGFWALGMWAGWKLARSGNPRWWYLIGLATGLGLDSKYPALLIPLAMFLYLGWDRSTRALVFNRHMLASAALAIALFSPVVIWNAQHAWASIRFQGGERMHQAVSGREKVASWLFQLGMLSPVGALWLAMALVWGWRHRRQDAIRFTLCQGLPFLLLMVYVSTRRLVQINWPMPGYLGVLPLLGAYVAGLRRPWQVAGGLGIGAFALLIPILLSPVQIGAVNVADDWNGWPELGRRVSEMRQSMARPDRTFQAGHGYQVAGELAFETTQPHLTLSNNVVGERALSFDYWESPRDFLGWDAIYVVYFQPRSNGQWRPRVVLEEGLLQRCFARVEGPEELILTRGGKPLRRFEIYRCFDYQGPP